MNWIPITEKLPKERQEILITLKMDWSYGKGTDDAFDVDIATFSTISGYIYSHDVYFDTTNDWLEGQPCEVIAWMPLPEPYKGIKEG